MKRRLILSRETVRFLTSTEILCVIGGAAPDKTKVTCELQTCTKEPPEQ